VRPAASDERDPPREFLLLELKQEIEMLLSGGKRDKQNFYPTRPQASQTKSKQSRTDASDEERVSQSLVKSYNRAA
jgi:hypothetical protein